ncbi:hypothetical protein COO59_19190 [Mixta theicola]|uniref:Uncharacterized protein n=2 Tax=Mixta theicola TaxID=1458355 RepID=A0A2K1Q509_9GAMM|nr:hypothetical protein COO59_19190 [Mixta theicola]
MEDGAAFMKRLPYTQLIKDMALARCFAMINANNKMMALDAGQSSNAMRSWAPYDIAEGDEKINAVIDKYKDRQNHFHVESLVKSKGYTLNCFRLYHSKDLDDVVKEVITENPEHNWYQDN